MRKQFVVAMQDAALIYKLTRQRDQLEELVRLLLEPGDRATFQLAIIEARAILAELDAEEEENL